MQWNTLAEHLFGPGHQIHANCDFLEGHAVFDGQPLTIVGTTGHAPIGVRLALAQPGWCWRRSARTLAAPSCC